MPVKKQKRFPSTPYSTLGPYSVRGNNPNNVFAYAATAATALFTSEF